MGGPSLGGNLGGSSSNTLNIRALQEVSQIQPGDFLIVEIPAGTRIIDFKNFMIGKKNITFANELTALRGDVDVSLSLSNVLSGLVLDGTGILYVKGLSSLNALTGHGGIRLGKTGMLQNNGGIYTFNMPVSTTFTFHDSGGNSNQWNAAFTVTNAGSAKWWTTYMSMTAMSANWQNTYTHTQAKSGNWESTYSTVANTSATWGSGSSKWTDGGDVTYLTSTTDRAAIGHTDGSEKLSVYGNISGSQEVYAGSSNSTQWKSTYSTVYNNSASWSGGGSNIFKTISTSGETDIVADSSTDTLNLSAMGNFEIQHHPLTDTIILSAGAGGGGGGGSGTMTTVKSDGSQVGGADIVTLDFSDEFTISETPDTEINISIAAPLISGKTEITSVDNSNDFVLIWDATDSGLKKVNPTNLGVGGGSSRTDFEIMMVSEVFR